MPEQSAYCIEYFYAKPEYRQQLVDALSGLVQLSRAEPECEQYDLLQDKTNPNLFIIIVRFASQQAMLAHENQPYIKEFESIMPTYCEKVIWNDAVIIE